MTTKMARSSWGLDTARDEWRMHAECTPETAELFFVAPGNGRVGSQHVSAGNRAALEICARCPVTEQCLADALAHPAPVGRIAGGQVVGRGRR